MLSGVMFGGKGNGYFVPILIALTRVRSTEGLPFIEANRSDFQQPAPPDTNAADIMFDVFHNRGKITAVVHLPNCTLEGDVSEINKTNLASNGWETCYFKAGSPEKSSGPVAVFIGLHSVLLRVPPINQRANSYLFRPLNQTRNENCEKLFIYAVNDSATLNICSNEFLPINMSSPSDRDIIKQEVSRKCFKRTISLGDGLLLNGLSRIARLQITSDQPVGILYGRDESSATNQSSTTTDNNVHGLGESSATNISSTATYENEKGLAACQFSPNSSVMGKLFVIVPWVRSSIMQVNIIGLCETVVKVQTPEKETEYNVTEGKTLTFTLSPDKTFIIEAGANITVQVTAKQNNRTMLCIAKPLHRLDPASLNNSENITDCKDALECSLDDTETSNFTVVCMDEIVNITLNSTRLNPSTTESYAVLENRTIFIYYFELNVTAIHRIQYPRSKCFIPTHCSVARGNDLTYKSVLIRTYSVVNLDSVLRSQKSSTESVSEKTSANVDMSDVNLRHTNERISDSTTKTLITESKLSEMLNVTPIQNIFNAGESVHKTSYQQTTMDVVSSRTPVSTFTSNAISGDVNDNFKAATDNPFTFKQNLQPGVIESNVSPSHSNVRIKHYPMQEENGLPDSINDGFKVAVDIVQLDEHTHIKSGNENPPYMVNSDVFVSMESELDARNSMAVIISLSAALVAVMLVILVFFITEVFSRRRYIRHIRIRPSRSFY